MHPRAAQSVSGTLRKGVCTDRHHVPRAFQNGYCENEWSHYECAQKIFSATQNPKFPKASVISSEFFTVTPKVAPVGSGSPYFGLRLLYSPPPGGASVNNNLVSVSIECI